jgi:putative PIN family toxin of toxin-antitoxin system
MRVVLDTSVLVAAWRSRNGASAALLGCALDEEFEVAVSVPLVMEYEEVLARQGLHGHAESDARDLIDGLCSVALRQPIYFLWRPVLRDAHDDMVLEVAVGSGAAAIATHNVRDFAGVDRFGLEALTPAELLLRIRGVP